MRPNKKLFSLIAAFPLLLTLLFSSPAPSRADEPPGAERISLPETYTIADAYLNEELVYNIGFWFLDDVAVGKVSLRKAEDGDYVATLTAHTTGSVLDWMLRHRKDIYIARMKISGDGKRFVTKSFEKRVDMGGKVRKSLSVFDYEKKVMTWKSWKDGGEERSGEAPIPSGIYCDDPLTAFYNFRFGVYGPIEEGREYRIYTFPKEERVPEIYLRVAKKDEKEKRQSGPMAHADYLAEVKLDKDLFGSRAGDIDIFFTRDMMPVEAVAKEVLLFGDVKGKLAQVSINMGFVNTNRNETGVRLVNGGNGGAGGD